MDKFYHATGNGKVYGPSLPNETLAEYKFRVKKVYGNLRNVKFGVRSDFHPFMFSL